MGDDSYWKMAPSSSPQPLFSSSPDVPTSPRPSSYSLAGEGERVAVGCTELAN